jgi:hypothetical protein
VSVCVFKREKEGEGVCVCVYACVCVREREGKRGVAEKRLPEHKCDQLVR